MMYRRHLFIHLALMPLSQKIVQQKVETEAFLALEGTSLKPAATLQDITRKANTPGKGRGISRIRFRF